MAMDKPDSTTVIFKCDRCHTTLDLSADEGHPVADVVACIAMLKDVGWSSKKVVGYAWEHYCDECSKLPDVERRPVAE